MKSIATTTSIATVDDHPLTRYAFRTLLNEHPGWQVAAECELPSQLLPILAETRIDVAVIDLLFSEESGIELIEHLNQAYPAIRTIVYSMRSERHYVQRCFQAGAVGYVSKDEHISTIITAVEHALAGKCYVSEHMADILYRTNRFGSKLDDLEQLSNRELEVFNFIGLGMDTQQIAESISRSPKTVETYRHRIKKKLSLGSSTELAQLACVHANGWGACQ